MGCLARLRYASHSSEELTLKYLSVSDLHNCPRGDDTTNNASSATPRWALHSTDVQVFLAFLIIVKTVSQYICGVESLRPSTVDYSITVLTFQPEGITLTLTSVWDHVALLFL